MAEFIDEQEPMSQNSQRTSNPNPEIVVIRDGVPVSTVELPKSEIQQIAEAIED